MSDAMEINQESLEKIGEYVRSHLPDWLPEASEATGAAVPAGDVIRRELELRERMVRVEDELRVQRDLIKEGFADARADRAAMRNEMAQRSDGVAADRATIREGMARQFDTAAKDRAVIREEMKQRSDDAAADRATIREEMNRRSDEAAADRTTIREEMNRRSDEAAADRATIREEMNRRSDEAAADRTTIREEMNRRHDEALAHMNAIRDGLIQHNDERFDGVGHRFSDLNGHINRWMTVMAILMTFMTATVAVTNLM